MAATLVRTADRLGTRGLSSAGSADDSGVGTGGRATSRTSPPSILHYLYANPNVHKPLACSRPVVFDEGKQFPTKSEKERYQRITRELAMLKTRLKNSGEKAELVALAVGLQSSLASLSKSILASTNCPSRMHT